MLEIQHSKHLNNWQKEEANDGRHQIPEKVACQSNTWNGSGFVDNDVKLHVRNMTKSRGLS